MINYFEKNPDLEEKRAKQKQCEQCYNLGLRTGLIASCFIAVMVTLACVCCYT